MALTKIKIAEKLSLFQDHWNPRIAAKLNGQEVKLAKLQGRFEWHHHDLEDELFMVIRGTLRMDLREEDGSEYHIDITEGEFLVVPHGIEHCPVAEQEVHLLLFEPASTLNTGNVRSERTRETLQSI